MDPSSPSAMASLVARARRVRHPHRQRRRRRPPRHRHARRRADEPEPLPRGRDRLPVLAPSGLAGGCRGRQDPGLVDDHRPRRRVARPDAARGAGRVQVVRARPARRLGRLRRRGVGRRVVPAQATARSGRPTRTASCCACWPPRSSPSPARRPRSGTPSSRPSSGHPPTSASTHPRRPRRRPQLGKLVARGGHRDRARRRADHREAVARAGQRRRDRRPQGRDRARLVRRAPVRHRGRLQALRRVAARPGAPREVQEEARAVVAAALGGA